MSKEQLFQAINEKNIDGFKDILSNIKSQKMKEGKRGRALILAVKDILEEKGEKDTTLLHEASRYGLLDFVQLLVEYEVDLTAKNLNKKTAYDLAAENMSSKGLAEVAAFLKIRMQLKKDLLDRGVKDFLLDRNLKELRETYNHLFSEKIKHDEIVLLVGKTGSGKGVFLNYLNGCNYELVGEPGKDVILTTKPCENEIAGVGRENTVVSHTKIASLVTINGIHFVDTPGFEDTRDDALALSGMISVQILSQRVKKIALLYVIDMPDLMTGKSRVISQAAERLDNFLKHKSSEYTTSVFFIITKKDKQTPEIICKNIINPIVQAIENGENSVSTSVANFIKQICGQKSMLIVPDVFDKGLDRQNIFKKLEMLHGIDSQKFEFSNADQIMREFPVVTRLLISEYYKRFTRIQKIPSEIDKLQEELFHVDNDFNLRETTLKNAEITLDQFQEINSKVEATSNNAAARSVILEAYKTNSIDLDSKKKDLSELEKKLNNVNYLRILTDTAAERGKKTLEVVGVGVITASGAAFFSPVFIGYLNAVATFAGSLLTAPVVSGALAVTSALAVGYSYLEYQEMLGKLNGNINSLKMIIEDLNKTDEKLREFIRESSLSKDSLNVFISDLEQRIKVTQDLIKTIGNNSSKIKENGRELVFERNAICIELTTNQALFLALRDMLEILNFNDAEKDSLKKIDEVLEKCNTKTKEKNGYSSFIIPGADSSELDVFGRPIVSRMIPPLLYLKTQSSSEDVGDLPVSSYDLAKPVSGAYSCKPNGFNASGRMVWDVATQQAVFVASGVDGLGGHYTAKVYEKTLQAPALVLASEAHRLTALPMQGTFDRSSCSSVEYQGVPSVVCDNDTQTMVYQAQALPPHAHVAGYLVQQGMNDTLVQVAMQPFSDLSGNAALLVVCWEAGRQLKGYFRDWWHGRKSITSEYLAEEEARIALEVLDNQLCVYAEDLARAKKAYPQTDWSWGEFALGEHRETLSERYVDQRRLTAADLAELEADLEAFGDEFRESVKEAKAQMNFDTPDTAMVGEEPKGQEKPQTWGEAVWSMLSRSWLSGSRPVREELVETPCVANISAGRVAANSSGVVSNVSLFQPPREQAAALLRLAPVKQLGMG